MPTWDITAILSARKSQKIREEVAKKFARKSRKKSARKSQKIREEIAKKFANEVHLLKKPPLCAGGTAECFDLLCF
ncbi:MAG: hypothetical protein IJ438_04395 [Clostridia bacterium]|nr:hypothetical protein [Clostridia bacterium]